MPKFADNNDIFQTIVYVLIGLVVLVASAYKSYNKQREMENKRPPENKPDFPDVSIKPVFEYEPEVTVDEEEEIPDALNAPSTMIMEVEKTNVPTGDLKKTDQEGEPDFESTKEILLEDEDLTSEDIFQHDLTKDLGTENEPVKEGFDFDARKAVIFSEILKTKFN